MELKTLLPERIKKARAKKGFTQGDLANAAGIHEKAIFKYESGQVLPNSENLKKLVEALEVSCDYLLFEHAKMDGIPKVKKPTLYERYLVLESLTEEDQHAAILLLDGLIARREFKKLVERI